MQDRQYFVYIMASASGTLYTGVTNDLYKRVYQHKNDLTPGFTKKYKCHKIVYIEETSEVESAIIREKQIKGWTRKKKEDLIKTKNPHWKDFSNEWK